jgi:hypothetical protein
MPKCDFHDYKNMTQIISKFTIIKEHFFFQVFYFWIGRLKKIKLFDIHLLKPPMYYNRYINNYINKKLNSLKKNLNIFTNEGFAI